MLLFSVPPWGDSAFATFSEGWESIQLTAPHLILFITNHPRPRWHLYHNLNIDSHKASDAVIATKMKRRRRDDRLAQRGPRRACALKG